MTPEELRKEKNVLLIDIREEYELAYGKIEGSIHIPMPEIQNHLAEFKDKKVVFYCMTGSRSDFLVRMLKHRGFDNVHSLEGGIVAYEV